MSIPVFSRPIDRRALLAGLSAAAFVPFARPAVAQAAAPTIWGMPASPSVVLARAAAILDPSASGPADFKVWRTDDQMRAGVVSGSMDLFAAPSYAVANLRSKGAGVRLVNVLTWGLLSVMTARGAEIVRPEDLAGKTVLVAFKNDAPDLLFRLILKWAGLDPDRDVTLSYAGTSAEVVPLFLAGKADIAVLPEPAASAAEIKARKAGIEVRRALDVTDLYNAHTGRTAGIPQAGLAVTDAFLDAHGDVVAALEAACVTAGAWVRDNPKQAGALGAEALGLPAPIVEASLPRFRLAVTSAADAHSDLELYFDNLMSLNPGVVGGKLPEDAYYWGG